MKLYYCLLTTIMFSFKVCTGQVNSVNQPTIFADTNKIFKKEISPSNTFYSVAKAKQKQLKLDSLENGFDNLQIRLWYDFSLIRERRLVVITNKGTNWTATVYYLQVDWDGNTETILSKKIKQVTPKSGWAAFSKKLSDLKILALPDQNDIKGYELGFDGRTYNVEIATKSQYRFYGYWEPQENQDKFWQAKNMAEIIKLFETELKV